MAIVCTVAFRLSLYELRLKHGPVLFNADTNIRWMVLTAHSYCISCFKKVNSLLSKQLWTRKPVQVLACHSNDHQSPHVPNYLLWLLAASHTDTHTHTHMHLSHSFRVVFIHLQKSAAAASPHCFQVCLILRPPVALRHEENKWSCVAQHLMGQKLRTKYTVILQPVRKMARSFFLSSNTQWIIGKGKMSSI